MSDETVYVALGTHGGKPNVYHTNPDCDRSKLSKALVEKPKHVLAPNTRECKFCSGEAKQPDTTGKHLSTILSEMSPDELETSTTVVSDD